MRQRSAVTNSCRGLQRGPSGGAVGQHVPLALSLGGGGRCAAARLRGRTYSGAAAAVAAASRYCGLFENTAYMKRRQVHHFASAHLALHTHPSLAMSLRNVIALLAHIGRAELLQHWKSEEVDDELLTDIDFENFKILGLTEQQARQAVTFRAGGFRAPPPPTASSGGNYSCVTRLLRHVGRTELLSGAMACGLRGCLFCAAFALAHTFGASFSSRRSRRRCITRRR